MTGGQIASLVFAILLLLPGGCFLVFGIGFASDTGEFAGLAVLLLAIAVAILGVAGLLFWLAFRRREPPRTN
jgi:membrane protein implicated in regulation of membrane protease activity